MHYWVECDYWPYKGDQKYDKVSDAGSGQEEEYHEWDSVVCDAAGRMEDLAAYQGANNEVTLWYITCQTLVINALVESKPYNMLNNLFIE